MNFLGIGPWEILIILLVAFLVVGPQRLPEVAVQLARIIRWLRRYAAQVTGQFRQEFEELVHEYDELRQELTELRQQVGREAATTKRQVDEAMQETRSALSGGPPLETSAEPPSEETTAEPSSRP